MEVLVLVPIYNDWESAFELAKNLEKELASSADQPHLLLIDDFSTEPAPERFSAHTWKVFHSVTHLRLRTNLGHQRAIAVGLSWESVNTKADAVVVMDGDGEDKPDDVPRLIEAFHANAGQQAVFAERTRRSEGALFKIFYALYRGAHRLLTGLGVKFGNFSILPANHVRSLTTSSYLWYHYAATVVRTRLPMSTIKTFRGTRYFGQSKMNFVSLVRHGLSAIAVHSELVSVRLLIATVIVAAIGVLALGVCVWIRLFTPLAIPGWATTTSGLIAIVLIQILSVAFIYSMQSVSVQGGSGFLPVRDFEYFVSSVRVWSKREE